MTLTVDIYCSDTWQLSNCQGYNFEIWSMRREENHRFVAYGHIEFIKPGNKHGKVVKQIRCNDLSTMESAEVKRQQIKAELKSFLDNCDDATIEALS
jgi:hypothetical protein